MKLEAAFTVIVLCGWTLSLPQKRVRSHYYNLAQQQMLRQLQRSEQPLDKFNFLDLELLQQAADSEHGNIILSPTSVKTTLSMLWEGADGRSAQEIGLALRLNGRRENQEEQLHRYQHNLTNRPTLPDGAPASSTLEVASQVFASERVTISPTYTDALGFYRASVQKVNMSDPQQAAKVVNKWVNAATRGLVPSLVQPENLSDSPIMVIANAIYFQGTWQMAFDPQQTREECFYADPSPAFPKGECIKVQMMETMGTFRSKLIHELDATLLELPYDDGRFSMLILLPEKQDGMQTLMRNLPFSNLLHILNGDLEDSEYVISIPKFSIEFNTDLVPVLNKLRVVDVFSPSANLSRMVKSEPGKMEPSVSNVFHKAKVVVDERGAIAAGASGALVVPLMGGPQPRFRADHPFLFFIRDAKTGGFLFAGRVSRPKGSASSTESTSDNEAAAAEPAAQSAAAPTSTTSKRSQTSVSKDSADINFPNREV